MQLFRLDKPDTVVAQGKLKISKAYEVQYNCQFKFTCFGMMCFSQGKMNMGPPSAVPVIMILILLMISFRLGSSYSSFWPVMMCHRAFKMATFKRSFRETCWFGLKWKKLKLYHKYSVMDHSKKKNTWNSRGSEKCHVLFDCPLITTFFFKLYLIQVGPMIFRLLICIIHLFWYIKIHWNSRYLKSFCYSALAYSLFFEKFSIFGTVQNC